MRGSFNDPSRLKIVRDAYGRHGELAILNYGDVLWELIQYQESPFTVADVIERLRDSLPFSEKTSRIYVNAFIKYAMAPKAFIVPIRRAKRGVHQSYRLEGYDGQ